MPVDSVSTELPEQIKPQANLADELPVRNNLKIGYIFSLLIVICTAMASIAGILFADEIYPTVELGQSFIANDVVTLFIGLPILLVSMWLTYRGKLVGLLFWPGAIFYGLYNYTVYLISSPLTIVYPLYLIIVTLSIYTVIGIVASIDGEQVKLKLTGHVPERLSSAPLIALGFLFGVRAIGMLVNAAITDIPLPGPELGLLVTDFIACAAWVIGGVLLWRHQAIGYVGGTGLLFSTSMLFIGLIVVLLLQPMVSGGPLLIMDIVVVAIMGLICFVPFVLYVRGVVKS